MIGKLFERLIKTALCDHLEVNNLLSSDQHGFRTGRSCTTNLLEFMEKVTSAVDTGSPYDVIYFDFSKAFDKVPRERLLIKLAAYGIQGNILDWIGEWLRDRKQATVLNGHISTWLEVLSGVPQGSVLGPILFIIFINDITSCAQNIDCIKIFADDAKSGNTVDTSEKRDALQQCVNHMFQWSQTWQMKFNAQKCKVLHVGHSNIKHQYSLNGEPLTSEIKETDVGVDICANLKPSSQCSKAARTATQVLWQVARSFHYRDKFTFVKIYKTYVRPHVEFASPCWNPWLEGDIHAIERVQEQFVRMVSGLNGSTYKEKLIELGLLTLQDRRLYFDLLETYKIIHGFNNVKYGQWFTLVRDSLRRVTRDSAWPLNIIPCRARLDVRANFYTNRVATKWNTLPHEMRSNTSIIAFKKALKAYLLDTARSEIHGDD